MISGNGKSVVVARLDQGFRQILRRHFDFLFRSQSALAAQEHLQFVFPALQLQQPMRHLRFGQLRARHFHRQFKPFARPLLHLESGVTPDGLQ
jgi:hypothetical protein